MKSVTLIVILFSLCVVSAIAVVTVRHQTHREFTRLQNVYRERDDLNIDWGRLQIEQSTWAAHGRVQQKAVEQLKMRMPKANEWLFVKDKEN